MAFELKGGEIMNCKKIISVLLIVALLNLTFFAQQKEAEAAVPAILFHPAVVTIAVPLLAYGITYLTVEALVALSNGAWQDWFSGETKDAINEAQETGRLEITEQVDNDFRNLAQNFTDRQVKYLTEGELQHFDIDREVIEFDSDVLYGNARVFVNPGYYFTSATIYLSHNLLYKIKPELDVVDGELKYAWQLYESDSGVDTLLYETEYIYTIDEMPAQELNVFIDENGNIEVDALGFKYSRVKPGVTFSSIEIVDQSSGFVQFNGVTATDLIKGVNYDIDDSYKNTSLVGKAIPIDTSMTYDQVMAKTPEEVHESAEEIGTETGLLTTLQNIWNAVREMPRTIAENIASAFEWARSLLQSIGDAVASISTALTTGLIGDLNIDTSVMRDIGSTFTNKFPFSLPWDLVRAVDIFDGSSGSLGPWVVSFPDPFGNNIQFTISIPEGMASYFRYIRWALLIVFDIALIYSTRRLLGGAQ